MLSQEVEEQLSERLVNRIEEANTSILKKIGEAIKKISTLSPSQAYQVSQILKYGGSYEEIAKELAKVSGKNVQDIYKIFDEVAKQNKQFAKDFYKYRGIDYIPYKDDTPLQNLVRSLASQTAGTYINIANTRIIGLVVDGEFKQLQQAYYDTIDKAILSVIQGKEDFYSSMRKTLKELGGNGLVQYESGRTRRLDSAVRMNMLDGIRQLNNETSKRFGQEYDADGVEISVHSNPAPDHADIQGRQFSNEQYDILENGGIAKDYKGNTYDGSEKRHISEYNCYHKIFSIVLGVSKPEYTDEQLKKIQEDNTNGFEFEGKHYTNYEGTQLQRRIELEVRKQKDTQILAKASGDTELVGDSQRKITKLTHKYNELCKISGLKPKKQRMSVSGYVRTKVDSIKQNILYKMNFDNMRNIIDNNSLSNLKDNFDEKGFYTEYNKFYNSLDKKELLNINDKFTKWDGNGEQPIGKYLNKKLNYDNKPSIISKEEFFIDEDGNPSNGETMFLDNNHWYRGIEDADIEKTKKYVEDFKYGDFFAGKGINGNGTYVTESHSYAERYAKYQEEGMLYIIPKDNAKIITVDKINLIKQDLLKNIDNYKLDNDLYIDFTTNIIGDNGYLASILGYDIVDLGEIKLVLNRGAIKVVK